MKVLAIDDHQITLEGVESLLLKNTQITTILTARTVSEAKEIFGKETIDLIISDYHLPEKNADEFLIDFKRINSNLKIIVLTQHAHLDAIKNLLDIRVNSIVLKSCGVSEIDAAIEEIINGKKYYSKDLLETVMDFEPVKNSVPNKIKKLSLSQRQKDVLVCYANDMSAKEITEYLYIGTKAIEVHTKNLKEKFNRNERAGVVLAAKEMGIIILNNTGHYVLLDDDGND